MSGISKTNVTFQSDRFNKTEQREDYINPDCYGDDVCAFMAMGLKDAGVETGTPIGEDWGWLLEIVFAGRTFSFCTNYHPDGFWLALIEPEKRFWQQLLGRAKHQVPLDLSQKIHGILSSAGDIRDVRWYSEEQFNRGKYEDGSLDPG